MQDPRKRNIFFSLLTLFSVAIIVALLYGTASEFNQVAKTDPPPAPAIDTDSLNQLRKIELHRYSGDIRYIESYINGRLCKLLFTTGGGETILSPEAAGLDSIYLHPVSEGGISMRKKQLSNRQERHHYFAPPVGNPVCLR